MTPLEPKLSLDNPYIFLFDCYSDRVVKFAYVIFILFIFPLKAARASQILVPRHQRCHIAPAVSITPLG
jgi:hypothetical protein